MHTVVPAPPTSMLQADKLIESLSASIDSNKRFQEHQQAWADQQLRQQQQATDAATRVASAFEAGLGAASERMAQLVALLGRGLAAAPAGNQQA